MTKTVVKVFLPGGIGSGNIEYKGRSVVFTDIEGNVFNIPETLIDVLYGFLDAKRAEIDLVRGMIVKSDEMIPITANLTRETNPLIEAREFAKETLVKPAKTLPEPSTKKSPTSYSRRTIHKGD